MKLYSAPGSCSAASHIALTEAGATFDLVKLNLREGRMLPDGRHLRDINPKDYVPVLETDDGELITENVALLLYIADQFPASQLAPACGTMARVRELEWLAYVNSEIHKTFSILFTPDLPDGMRPIVTAKLDKRFAYLDDALADSDFLMGDTFTVADAYLYIVSGWSKGLKYDLSGFSNVTAWRARVAKRESVIKVLET